MWITQVLIFNLVVQSSEQLNLPKEPNATKVAMRNSVECQSRKCELRALGSGQFEQAVECQKPLRWVIHIVNSSAYQNNPKIVGTVLEYKRELFCSSCQRFLVPISMYASWVKKGIIYQLHAITNGHNFDKVYNVKRHDFAQFRAVSRLFRLSTCLFVTPITIIANLINIFVLYHMLKASAGACLYYHQFELITDVLTTVVYAFGEHGFYWVQHERAVVCGHSRFSFPLQTGWTLLELSNFYNQMFLTLLIMDRCKGLKDPLQYQIKNHRRIAWKNFFLVVFGTIFFYSPFIFCFNFSPLKFALARELGFKTKKLDRFIISFYSLAPVILVVVQVGYAFKINRLFKTFLASDNGQWVQSEHIAQRRKDEKSKKQLLLGTVGLNIVICVLNGCSTIYGNEGMELFLKKVTGGSLWYDYSKQFMFTVRCVAVFANSTICILIHMVTCKAYRRAFKEAVIRKIC